MRFRSWLGRPFVVGAAIALLAFGCAVAALSRYGMTYDSPALFYSGDRTLFWLGHRDVPKALDLRGSNPPGFTTIFTASPAPGDPVSYPAFASLTAAITARLFPGLEPVDGHHLGLVLLHALALWGYCVFACRLLGRGAGIARPSRSRCSHRRSAMCSKSFMANPKWAMGHP